jgi:PRTRC genetic system protein B
MLQAVATTGASDLRLQSAILLYTESDHRIGATHATIHEVEQRGGRNNILAGRLVTDADLGTLIKGLTDTQQSGGAQWLESSVLAHGAGRTIWFTPSTTHSMFFECSQHVENGFDGHGTAPVPALVWMVKGQQFYCFAVKCNGRPERGERLYQAPFFNVWSNGQVCQGSAPFPKPEGDQSPSKWVDAFFASVFTHPNFKQKDRLIKGENPAIFWKSLLGGTHKSFPKKHLVGLPVKVGDLLAPDLVPVLGKIQRAAGEF